MTPPRLRKAMLTVHIACSVGWLGAIAAYVALNVPALTASDEQVVRAAYLMMEPVLLYAVVPLALVSFVTGVLQALMTPWGLFRHYWVVISLALTGFALLVLLLHVPAVEDMAELARSGDAGLEGLDGDLVHSVGGLLVLLGPLVLNVFKPRGLTPYGWRVAQRGGVRQDGTSLSRD
jgi:uncharacterized membrane protein